jgi:hypothetical protein
MGALPSIAKAGRGRICIKKRMTSLLPAIAFTSLAFQGPALAQDGGFPKQYLEWQQECVRKNLYTRPARRESLRRFGISVEIPEGMDFQVDGGGDSSTAWITEIEGIALKRCSELAERLHGMALPGRGVSSFSVSAKPRFPQPSQDDFVDAALILGQKRPVYTDGIEVWAVFTEPKSGKSIQVSSYDIDRNYFIQFLRSIRAD